MKILGLDLGANSLGWALIDTETQEIIDMGVRVFPAGVDNIGQGEREASKNATRAGAYRMRLQLDRKQKRRNELVRWLGEHLYWPVGQDQLKAFKVLDPYQLRAEALDRPLNKEELSRILLHLVKRRGYISNGKDTEAGSLYEGSAATGMIGANDSDWEGEGFRTYGEYLHNRPKDGSNDAKKRSRYTFRKWYKHEFDLIWETQKVHLPNVLTTANREVLEEQIIFFQRPLKIQKETRGRCKFIPTEKRTTKADPIFQQFAIYQQLNNLKFGHAIERQAEVRFQELPKAEQRKIIDKLYRADKVTLEDIKKMVLTLGHSWVDKVGVEHGLNVDKIEDITSNYDQQKALAGAPFIKFTVAELKGLVDTNTLADYMFMAQEAAKLFDQLENGVEPFILWFNTRYPEAGDGKALRFFTKAPAPKGTSSLSRKAIEELMQFMPNGKRYDEAMMENGWEHNKFTDRIGSKSGYQKSIYFEIDKRPDSLTKNCIMIEGTAVRNPVVSTCLFEMARVVNSIIKHHGNPDRIHLELAREAGMTPEERNEYIKKQKDNERKNFEAQQIIEQELGIPFASKSHINKYKLWKEQGGVCAYSGRIILATDLFGQSRVDVDHIIPQGVTGGSDDSYMNKVLCFTAENRDKGMRLPLEWLSGARATKLRDIVANYPSGYPDGKKERLFCPSMEELPKKYSGFTTRQLNDTRFATRHAMNICRAVVKDESHDGVLNVNGKVTHTLRNSWFPGKNENGRNYPFIYNEILDKANLLPSEWAGDKSRLDHRHHALDALVVALSTRRDTQLKPESNKRKHSPWGDSLAEQAKKHLEQIIVSYRICNKPNQALHNETLYGKIMVPPGKRILDNVSQGSLVATVRKNLSALTKGEIQEIVDNQVRDCVHAAITKKFPTWRAGHDLPKDWHKDLEVMHKNKLPIKKVRIAINALSLVQIRAKDAANYKDGVWVAPEGNHHAIIYRNIDTGKQRGEVIQYLDTAKRASKGELIIQPKPKPNEEVLMTLQRNEIVCFDVKDLTDAYLRNKRNYKDLFYKVFRVQKLDRGNSLTCFRSVSLAKIVFITIKANGDQSVGRKFDSFSTASSIKLKIDPAGFLTLAHE